MINSFLARRKMRWAIAVVRRARAHGYDGVELTRVGSRRLPTFYRKDGSAKGIVNPEAVAYIMEHAAQFDQNPWPPTRLRLR